MQASLSLSEQGMHLPRSISLHRLLQLAWWLLLVCSEIAGLVRGSLYTFEVTHRYSEKARKELQERHGDAFHDWPQEGTPEYHSMLYFLDLHRHHGQLAPASRPPRLMASSKGNTTYYNRHDGLQYTYIELGTPSQKYFVALDTGSDLLWLPCAHCVSCAPSLISPTYNATYNIYDPSGSTTHESVACDSPYCELARQCVVGARQCPYRLQYLSPASTEGYLVEDVMYLVPQLGGKKTATDIMFGCGTNQTGAFLSGSTVANGILGLGMQNISTPSILARAKVISDSFSMCFDYGLGTGRLVFGDRGSSKAQSTPIFTTVYPSHYWVSLRYVAVGGAHVLTPAMAIFDTGTTYTYLSSVSYSLVAAVDRAVPYRRVISPIEAFELCYAPPNVGTVELPTITLSFFDGANLEVLRPYVLINDPQDNMFAICLTILDSKSTYSIIGHNIMVNHSITFDRVKKKISWIQVPSCYKYQTSDADKDQAAWLLIATVIMLTSCYITIRNHSRNS